MKSTLKTLKLLADPTRLRIINVLNEESLSVAELQEILGSLAIHPRIMFICSFREINFRLDDVIKRLFITSRFCTSLS